MKFPRSMLLAGLMALASAQAEPPTRLAGEAHVISAADLLDRAHRVLRVSEENAQTWYAGLERLDAWPASLERALLEALGPDSVRSPEFGLGPLRALLNETPDSVRLAPEAHQLLTVLISLLESQPTLAQRSEDLAAALERERQAHLETLNKLAALREIDEHIEQHDSAEQNDHSSEP